MFTDHSRKRRGTLEKKSHREEKLARCSETALAEPWVLTGAQVWAHKDVEVCKLTEEQQAYMDAVNEEKAMSSGKAGDAKEATSIFHAKDLKDYAGEINCSISVEVQNSGQCITLSIQ